MFNPFYYLNKSGKGKTSMIRQSVVEVDNKVATIIVFFWVCEGKLYLRSHLTSFLGVFSKVSLDFSLIL